MAKQVWTFEPAYRWVRAVKDGVTVADSKRPMLMIESRGEHDYYFPLEDVQQSLLTPSDHVEQSGYRGTKRFWHLTVGDKRISDAAWTYDPKENRPDFSGHIAFDWNNIEHWYEELEEVFYHPRNPYHRVDYIDSSRQVEVFVDDVKVASSQRPLMVFETQITPRIYLPKDDVDDTFLTPTDTSSHCPYKGDASYYTIKVNGHSIEDAAWYYLKPIPEAPRLTGKIAFWPEKDKHIKLVVDGQPFPE